MTLQMTRFRAEVEILVEVYVDAQTEADVDSEARRLVRTRPRIRDAEIRSIKAIPLDITERMTQDNHRIWQEEQVLARGSTNDRARWRDGCLPEEDLLRIARNELFLPLALIPRRQRRGPATVHQGQTQSQMFECAVDGTVPVVWEMDADPQLTSTEWQTFTQVLVACEEIRRHPWMRSSPPERVRVGLRTHRGVCKTCKRSAQEVGALVEIDWAGRLLTREYVL